MTVNSNIKFSRISLQTARNEFKKLLPIITLRGLFTLKQSTLTKSKHSYEVKMPKNKYFPRGYYWLGSANNAYDARTKMIEKIIDRINRCEFEDEMFPIIMKPEK